MQSYTKVTSMVRRGSHSQLFAKYSPGRINRILTKEVKQAANSGCLLETAREFFQMHFFWPCLRPSESELSAV